MKKATMLAISLLLVLDLLAITERRNNVYFETNSTQLSSTAQLLLDTVYEKLPETNYMRIVPTGQIGDMNLGEASNIRYKRAEAIYEYYQSIGVGEKHLEILDLRKAEATASGFDSRLYNENELEVRIYKAPAKKEFTHTNLKDYFKQDVQKFTVNPYEEIIIKGKEGTVLTFPMNAFGCADGSMPSSVMTIELAEYYSYADLIKADLHTMSGAAMLETGGTVNVVAKCGDKEAKLRRGVEYTIEFPIKRWEKDGMQTFYGGKDGEDWQVEREEEIQQERYLQKAEAWNEEMMWLNDYDIVMSENEKALNSYILTVGELGFINCDRFVDVAETTNFMVSVDTSMHSSVKMIFKDIKSVMNGYATGKGEIAFNNIPVGEQVTLVAFSIQDDVPYMAVKEIRVTENGYDELKLSKTTKAAMESKFLALK